jgi:hypothetical protein
MAEMGNETVVVICPKCGRFALKGQFKQIETICNDRDCRANFLVEVFPDGSTAIRILPRQKVKA